MEGNNIKISTSVDPHTKKIIDNFREASGKTQAEMVRIFIIEGIKAIQQEYPFGLQAPTKKQRGNK